MTRLVLHVTSQVVRVFTGVRLFSYFAFCMFNYLFRWGDKHWDRSRKFLYFSQTPAGLLLSRVCRCGFGLSLCFAGTSSRTVAHWMQQSCVRRFFCNY